MTEKQEKYHKLLAEALKGRTITQIFYEERHHNSDEESWEISAQIHNVDMHILWVLDNAKLFQIRWDDEFFDSCYGVGGQYLNKIISQEETRIIEMSHHASWEKLLNNKILDIIVHWDIDQVKQYERENNDIVKQINFEISIPSTLEIRFESGKHIWISALEIISGEYAGHWDDNLTIFFESEDVKKYELTKNTTAHSC